MTTAAVRLLGTTGACVALAASIAGCSSNSTSSSPTTTSASVSVSTTTPTPTDVSTSGTPTDSSTPIASATPSVSATSPAASASASVPAAMGSFTGRKDATVARTLTQVADLRFATVKFPKALGGLPMLGDLDEGAANRYAGYSATNSAQTITATVAKNYSQDDVDGLVGTFTGASSYDGGRITCGRNPSTSGSACVTHIAGNDSITVSSPTTMSNDALVKFAVDFLNHQK